MTIKPTAAELETLQRWQLNLYQDQFEGAYVPVSLADELRRALTEVAPKHPMLIKPCASFGVWRSQRREIDEMRDTLSRVKTLVEQARWAAGMDEAELKLDELLKILKS